MSPEVVNFSQALRTSWNFPLEKEGKEHSRKGNNRSLDKKSRSIGAIVRKSSRTRIRNPGWKVVITVIAADV